MISKTIFMVFLLSFITIAESQELSEYQQLEKRSHIDQKSSEIERISLALSYDKSLVEFRTNQMDHNITILKWQHYSGIGVFFLVIILVLSGLYLSYLQFKKEDKATSATKIEAGAKGVSIDSPVIGLIILFMSFAFFYLYIMEVYTIKPIVLETQIEQDKNITSQSSRPPASAAD